MISLTKDQTLSQSQHQKTMTDYQPHSILRSFANSTLLLAILLVSQMGNLYAQAVPRVEENIPFLVTFGPQAPEDWGDDDHCSIFFISLPTDFKQPFYVRIFDPNIGGEYDENKGGFNTRTKFSVIGGTGAFSEPDARAIDPVGNYQAGTLLYSKTFDSNSKYDNDWYTFGPINPAEGEKFMFAGQEKIYFKIIAQGVSGDDGNLYRYFISSHKDENRELEGSEPFTFEYNFRMGKGMSHLYPFINEKVVRIRQHNFDFDNDGYLRICSLVRKSELVKSSKDGDWSISTHNVHDKEKGACMDLQIVSLVERRNNNMVFYITNQYGEALPFMNYPIGLEELANKIKVVKK